jgi:hypothetical protein
MRSLIIGLGLAVALSSTGVEARRTRSYSSNSTKSGPVCKKGKPCGNSCIAKNKACHKGTGTARAAER